MTEETKEEIPEKVVDNRPPHVIMEADFKATLADFIVMVDDLGKNSLLRVVTALAAQPFEEAKINDQCQVEVNVIGAGKKLLQLKINIALESLRQEAMRIQEGAKDAQV